MECNNPGGCTLDSTEMAERVNAWKAVSSRAISREVHADKITSVYPSEPEVTAQLKGLIEAEAVCCSFLQFSLEEGRDHMIVTLTFPEEARPLVESVIAAPIS